MFRTLGLAIVLVLAPSATPLAESFSPHGPDDTLGAINYLSPEKVVAAARLITTGKAYPLGVPTGPNTPAYGPRSYQATILQLSDGTGATLGTNKATGNDDLLNVWMGIGSQIDGLGHMGVDHVYYNGNHASEFVTTQGLLKFGIDTLPPIVTRGVLLDMTRHYGTSPLPEGTAFNQEEIAAAAKKQGVRLEKGDVVLFHTGWLDVADSDPKRFMAGQPGLGLEGARYLAGLGVVAVGPIPGHSKSFPRKTPRWRFPSTPNCWRATGSTSSRTWTPGPWPRTGSRNFSSCSGSRASWEPSRP